MNDTPLSAPSRPHGEPVTGDNDRLIPPAGWRRTWQGQLAARLNQANAPRAGQRQLTAGTAGSAGRAYMTAVIARLGGPRQPAADPEPEAGA